jgi:dephospho-CoA kinase
MIRIALTGGIGSGKSYISKLFGYPVFNADKSVENIYKKNKKIYLKIKKKFPNHFQKFPIKKKELIKAILQNKKNIKIISSIVHPIVRKDLQVFLKKHKKSKIVILDIPLYLENKLNKKKDIIIFVHSNVSEINKRLKKRENYNKFILQRLKALQFSPNLKRKKSKYVIKNDFKQNSVRKTVKDIIEKVLR